MALVALLANQARAAVLAYVPSARAAKKQSFFFDKGNFFLVHFLFQVCAMLGCMSL